MKIQIYPDPNKREEGFTAEEIRRGIHWLYADVTCPHCGKLQAMASTHYWGGPCIQCGKRTSDEEVPA